MISKVKSENFSELLGRQDEMRVHTIGIQANIPETRYTKIARGVQHRRAQKTDFAVLGALTNRRLRRDCHLVLTIRNRDDIRRLLSGATNQHGSLTKTEPSDLDNAAALGT